MRLEGRGSTVKSSRDLAVLQFPPARGEAAWRVAATSTPNFHGKYSISTSRVLELAPDFSKRNKKAPAASAGATFMLWMDRLFSQSVSQVIVLSFEKLF